MKKSVFALAALSGLLFNCRKNAPIPLFKKDLGKINSTGITFNSCNKKLNKVFHWAKNKAFSFAHDDQVVVSIIP